MNKNYFSKAKRIFSIVLLFVTVGLLSYCTTTGKFASRKYTKGHFFDRVAKVDARHISSPKQLIAAVSPKKVETNNTIKQENDNAVSNPQVISQNNLTAGASNLSGQSSNPTGVSQNSKDNSISAPENTVTKAASDIDYAHDNHQAAPSRAGTYLIVWLACIALSLIFFLLIGTIDTNQLNGSSGQATNALGEGCLFLTLSIVLGIAGLVFFILWLVALTSGS